MLWVLSAIPEAKGLIMQECRTNPQVVDPNDLSQSQVMWAAGWAGPRSLLTKCSAVLAPAGNALHLENRAYMLFSMCKEGKCRVYVMKLCREIE